MRHKYINIAFYLLVFVALTDQFSKWWVLTYVMKPPHLVSVTSFLNLGLVWNKGMTFGMLNHINLHYMSYVLISIAIIILALLARWLWRTTSVPVAVGLGAIMGGAIGNVIDRLRYGAVVDFLDFYYHSYHWYTFNIADAAIVTGVALLALDSMVKGR